MPEAQNESQRQHGADQIAGDHDMLAIEPVKHHAGDRSGEHGRDGA